MGRDLRHGGGSAEPEALRSDIDPAVEKTREADETVGPAHIFLQELHHVGAARDVFSGRIGAAGLGSESERGGKIARTFEAEGMHGLTSADGTSNASRVLDRRDDVVVSSAAAQVAAHPVPNLL